MELTILAICCLSFLIIGIVILFFSTFRVVNEHHRNVVFRLGRMIGQKGPGLMLIIPFVDRTYSVDLRDITRKLENLPAITIDGFSLFIDISFLYKINDPIKSVMNVSEPKISIENIIGTEMREIISKLTYLELLQSRGKIILELRQKVNPIAENWGIEILDVDINDMRKRN
jgi:regulator of protease activity HflC (stomatin/prohibitin superfamily)